MVSGMVSSRGLTSRTSEPVLPVPFNSTMFGINGNDPAARELGNMQDNDENPHGA